MSDNNLIKLDNQIILEDKFDLNSDTFNKVMFVYYSALREVMTKLQIIKDEYKIIYNYNLIDHINTRIKSSKSIIDKMERKKLKMTYKEMMENINDIAGIRIICANREDIYKILEIVKKIPNFEILKEKDYVKKPKKSGYSSYHIILNVPVAFSKDVLYIKVEIQIRTIAMDLWSEIEHDVKYKSDQEISKSDKKKLLECAKLIMKLDKKMSSLYQIK